jgi:hypothetical protein
MKDMKDELKINRNPEKKILILEMKSLINQIKYSVDSLTNRLE